MRSLLLTLRKNYIELIQARKYCYGNGRIRPCDAHMNELPIPCGPWQPWYNNKQRTYNRILTVGILWWLFSFGMMLWTNSLFLNWATPSQPTPPTEMIPLCDDIEEPKGL